MLIVGAGPAGSTLATLAASAGARVTLVERSRFPRDKVCGEFVSAEGRGVLERLGVLAALQRAGAVATDSCRVTNLSGKRFDAPLPRLRDSSRSALGVSRALLDQTLLERASDAGVSIRTRTEAIDPILDEGRVRGYHLRPVGSDRREAVRASLVVAADGRRSLLARRLHGGLCDPPRTGRRSWFGLATHLEGSPSRLGGRVELHLFDGGYVGLGAVEGARINLCAMVTVDALRACGGRPERLLAERLLANPALRQQIGDSPRTGRWLSVGPLRWGVRRAAAGGAMFVGDAAGTVDPFCGEGISNALRGGEVALPHAMAALERGELTSGNANDYATAWAAEFAPVTRRVRRIGRLLERPALAGPAIALLGGAASAWAPRLIAATRTGSVG
jgi:flavin-dependent dehydrogenase